MYMKMDRDQALDACKEMYKTLGVTEEQSRHAGNITKHKVTARTDILSGMKE